jgi:elongation factor G
MQDIDRIRNVGIIAHIDAGKTSTTENMLFYSGLTHRIGNIDEGTTVMDYLDEERARGITIVAAAAAFEWRGKLVHLIDTPGHIDFTAEVERSLRVIDGAVVIFSGVEGVEAQSEKVWRQAEYYHVPKIAFINKLDRLGASFERVLAEINDKFGNCAVPVQLPVGIESGFSAIVDVLEERLITFEGEYNETIVKGEVPEERIDELRHYREMLVERLADSADEVAELYLEGKHVPAALLRKVLRRETLANRLVPVFTGSAKNRIGVQPLLDGVVEFLPSPAECPPALAHRVKEGDQVKITPDENEAFCGLIFKVVANTSADLLYMRTYSGTIKAGARLVNSRTKETIGSKQLLRLFAKSTQPLQVVGPGDIVGVIGPRNCGTGDTLCEAHRLVAFERMAFPEPVISVAVEPKASRDKGRLGDALQLLCREDPTLDLARDEETGQWLFSGMGELHLEINLKRLEQEFRVPTKSGEPRVAYRETFRQPDRVSYLFHKFIGETELQAGVEIAFKPIAGGAELFKISSRLERRKDVPKGFSAAAQQALSDGLRTGGNSGYPLIYVDAEVIELQIFPDSTTENAVVGAVLGAIDKAIREVGTTVLEPLMHLEILAPPEAIGDVTTYLQPRRAVIHQLTETAGGKRISCEVPLAEMFGFGKALPKLSGGRASFTMEPRGYQEVPHSTSRAAGRPF